MRPYVSAPQPASARGSAQSGQVEEQESVPDLLGQPEHRSGYGEGGCT